MGLTRSCRGEGSQLGMRKSASPCQAECQAERPTSVFCRRSGGDEKRAGYLEPTPSLISPPPTGGAANQTRTFQWKYLLSNVLRVPAPSAYLGFPRHSRLPDTADTVCKMWWSWLASLGTPESLPPSDSPTGYRSLLNDVYAGWAKGLVRPRTLSRPVVALERRRGRQQDAV